MGRRHFFVLHLCPIQGPIPNLDFDVFGTTTTIAMTTTAAVVAAAAAVVAAVAARRQLRPPGPSRLTHG